LCGVDPQQPYPRQPSYNPGLASVTETAAYAGATILATTPSSANPNGGSDVTTLALGPDGDGIDASAWGWGAHVTLASITAAQAQSALGAALAATPPSSLTAANPTSLADGTSPNPQWWWWGYSGETFDGNGNVNTGNQDAQVYLATANPSLFGLVPQEGDYPFEYSATLSAPQLSSPGALPAGQLPPTTALDYLNAVPDTDADDIVDVSADLTSLGNDTGSIGRNSGTGGRVRFWRGRLKR